MQQGSSEQMPLQQKPDVPSSSEEERRWKRIFYDIPTCSQYLKHFV